MKLKIIYSPFPDLDAAKNIARVLLNEKLAACINITPNTKSIFLWKEDIDEAEEVVLIAKTLKPAETIKKISELHPYKVPCVLEFDVSNCNESFLAYVKEVTN